MPNQFIIQQCDNILRSIELFEMGCEMAARRDDGEISKDETKTLKAIKAANERYKREITKIKMG